MEKKYLKGVLVGFALCSLYLVHETITAQSIETEDEPQKTVETKVSQEEIQEYKGLGFKKAQEEVERLTQFVLLASEITKLLPKTITIEQLGVTIKAHEISDEIVGVLFNASEFILKIFEFIDKDKGSLGMNMECLGFTDEELRQASGEVEETSTVSSGKSDLPVEQKKGEFNIDNCMPLGCATKQKCIAILILRLVNLVRPLFQNAVAKANPATGEIERGFIMNITKLIKELVEMVTASKPIQDYLDKQGKKETIEKWIKGLDKAYQVIQIGAIILEKALGATGRFAAILEPSVVKYLDPAEQEKAKAIIRDRLTEKVPLDEKAQDEIFDSLEDDDFGNLDLD